MQTRIGKSPSFYSHAQLPSGPGFQNLLLNPRRKSHHSDNHTNNDNALYSILAKEYPT